MAPLRIQEVYDNTLLRPAARSLGALNNGALILLRYRPARAAAGGKRQRTTVFEAFEAFGDMLLAFRLTATATFKLASILFCLLQVQQF
jgi:hypothetical protein